MSGPDASWYDMPGFPSPGSLRREPDEPLLDMIVAGLPLPPDAPQRMVALASGLAELAGPAGPGELAGEADVLSAYSAAVSPAGVSAVGPSRAAISAPPHARARRRPRRSVAWRVRLAAGIAFAGIVASGTAAAYAGVLPAPVQDVAHTMIGAPAGHEHRSQAPEEHAGVGGRSDRGRHGTPSASRGKHAHGKVGHGKKARGQKARGPKTRSHKARDKKPAGRAKGHTRPKHPTLGKGHSTRPVYGPRLRG